MYIVRIFFTYQINVIFKTIIYMITLPKGIQASERERERESVIEMVIVVVIVVVKVGIKNS